MKKLFKWEYKPSGNCPVQSKGWFLGYYFYFRARGSSATIEFYKDKGDFELYIIKKSFVLKQTAKYRAGWISKTLCKWLIYKGCLMFLLCKK